VAVVFVNLLVDLSYAAFDPRSNYEGPVFTAQPHPRKRLETTHNRSVAERRWSNYTLWAGVVIVLVTTF
jgi:hypothetical protein